MYSKYMTNHSIIQQPQQCGENSLCGVVEVPLDDIFYVQWNLLSKYLPGLVHTPG